MVRILSIGLLSAAIVIISGGLGTMATSAHALYVRSEPPFNAVLATSPAQVKIWFTQEPAASGARIKVSDQMGRKVDKDDTKVSFDDPKMISVGLNNVGAGSYLVEWALVSAEDGDPSQGSFTFSVGSIVQTENADGLETSTLISGLALTLSLAGLFLSIYALKRKTL